MATYRFLTAGNGATLQIDANPIITLAGVKMTAVGNSIELESEEINVTIQVTDTIYSNDVALVGAMKGKLVTLEHAHFGPGRPVSPYFQKVLTSVTSVIVPQSEHGLAKVRGARVLTPSGRSDMEVYAEVRTDGSAYIESLVNLDNHILILY